MSYDAFLGSTQLFDCQGRVTHTLTAMPDGTVRVQTGAVTVTVDPATGARRPRGVRLGAGEYSDAQIMGLARSLAADPTR